MPEVKKINKSVVRGGEIPNYSNALKEHQQCVFTATLPTTEKYMSIISDLFPETRQEESTKYTI
jgi:hypothetical protein